MYNEGRRIDMTDELVVAEDYVGLDLSLTGTGFCLKRGCSITIEVTG